MDFSNEKYEHVLHTWGGFYNKAHADVHGYKPGHFFFDTLDDLNDYLVELREVENRTGARMLATATYSGQHVRYKTIARCTLEFKGKIYQHDDDFGYGYPVDDARWNMEEGSFGSSTNLLPRFAAAHPEIGPIGDDDEVITKNVEIVQVKE